MSEFVLDCSLTVSWLFADEATPATERLLEQLGDGPALVPSLWHLEVGNVLLTSERGGRISVSQSASCLELLGRLPIEVDAETSGRALSDVLALARTERLTTYDAAYLELAMRRGMALATRDRALRRASRRVGVTTLPR